MGEAVYLGKTDAFQLDFKSSSYFLLRFLITNISQIIQSFMDNCTAINSNGGALYVSPIHKLNILNSSLTINYSVQQRGAIYTSCISPFKCEFNFKMNSTFTQNAAGITGGAIYLNDVEPNSICFSPFIFRNNLARLYRDDIASYAQKIVKLNQSQFDSINFRASN